MENIRDISSGRTSRARSVQTKGKTSGVYSKQSQASKAVKLIYLDLKNGQVPDSSWQKISVSHGGFLMLSTGECPREENASTLSQILQAGVPEKYYLSQKACLGILRRASERGKQLPDVLKRALERQAASA